MKCLACGAEMRLMDVRTDTMRPFGIERHVFQCPSCRQIAQRLKLNRPRTANPVAASPEPHPIKMHMRRHAAHAAVPNGGDTFNSRSAALKQQTTIEWGRTVENLTLALKEQAAAARASAWSKTMEKLRHRQIALKEQAASARTVDGKFSPVWNAQSPKGSTGGGDLVLSE